VAIRANDWIRQAERNLKSGEVNYSNQLYEEACYESHQASEKAIKALLKTYYKDLRGRSLIYLIQPIVHSLTFWGVKGAEVPLRKVGDEYPPYRNLFILKKR